ncbi:hypothetical protein EYB26_003637 [Talaromyces marneffei]|uniref:uncharacterized protein n=1 Tax=Talaromyces marneffei TaxID=37727 RepID=UPI0012A82FD0|nr:uncharacterized protein EYB26_003637 [Talaromyces marneffei]QGA15970.1 hypothetical protein EYB26_003637 [Talaromyces marneffei]
MDAVNIYGIAVGGILLLLIVARLRPALRDLARVLSIVVSKYLVYPYLLNRHRWFGPWTWAGIIKCLVYGASNCVVILYNVHTYEEASIRAGRLALVNMTVLFMAPQLSVIADILGISLEACQWIHRAAGWMTCALVTTHVLTIQQDVDPKQGEILFAIIGAVSFAMIIISTFPVLQTRIYEVFLRTHQALAVLFFYSIWRHLSSGSVFPRLYLYVPLSILCLITVFQVGKFLYQNSFLSSRPKPRATVTCRLIPPPIAGNKEGAGKEEEKDTGRIIKIRVTLGRPLSIAAGQCIHLWMPSVSLGSWMQSHPFVVTSWSPEKQTTLELFVQVRRGFTAALHQRASASGSASFCAFVRGPFGVSHSLSQYETVVAVASNAGIAGVVPYLKQLLYSYNTMAGQIRRLHLVWEVDTLDMVVEAQPLLNDLLKDDSLANGYIFEVSIYTEAAHDDGESFGEHNRAFRYHGKPDYNKIISTEVADDYIERIPSTPEQTGEILILTSVSNRLRDHLKSVVRGYLGKKVTMQEVDYRPSEIIAQ